MFAGKLLLFLLHPLDVTRDHMQLILCLGVSVSEDCFWDLNRARKEQILWEDNPVKAVVKCEAAQENQCN